MLGAARADGLVPNTLISLRNAQNPQEVTGGVYGSPTGRGRPMPRLCSSLLLSLLIASSASAVTMAWTPIGNPGNAADPDPNTRGCGVNQNQACGAVPYSYNIGTYEVTNAQYADQLVAEPVVEHGRLADRVDASCACS